MKKVIVFTSCIALVVSLLLCTGCVRTVIKTDHRPTIVRPVKTPSKKFYVTSLQSTIPQSLALSSLNETLVRYYPHLFAKVYSEDVIPVTLSISAEPVSNGSFLGFCQAVLAGLNYMIIFPVSETIEEKLLVELLYQEASSGPILKREVATSERTVTTHTGLSPTASIFFTSYDYGPYSSSELGKIQNVFYEEIAALIVAAYNRNPNLWETIRTTSTKSQTVSTPQIGNGVKKATEQAYSVVRKSFDAQSNMGKFRIRFNEDTPSEGTLSAIQEDVRNFCRTAYRENNPGVNSESLLILREDYRAIGKTLKLYEFTLTLGAVEFIGLQYDNATLLGTITIRLPGGNPENARKWVTENLDRLVEEYNISADEMIDGEYQLTSEKMSADGTYTVAFEVVN